MSRRNSNSSYTRHTARKATWVTASNGAPLQRRVVPMSHTRIAPRHDGSFLRPSFKYAVPLRVQDGVKRNGLPRYVTARYFYGAEQPTEQWRRREATLTALEGLLAGNPLPSRIDLDEYEHHAAVRACFTDSTGTVDRDAVKLAVEGLREAVARGIEDATRREINARECAARWARKRARARTM